MIGPRIARLATPLCVAALLSLALPAPESFAQAQQQAPKSKAAPRAKAASPRAARPARAATPRASRTTTPRAVRRATPSANKAVTRQKAVRRATPGKAATQRRATVPRRTGKALTQPKTTVTPRAKRTVTPGTAKALAPKAARRLRQTTRSAPANLALVNAGSKQNPGRYKPAHVQHDPARRAGRAGWMHRHQAFYFKRGEHRWRRSYYSFLAGGLWYWYWYDVSADEDPGALVYSVLPECDADVDDCTESDALIAPAILEGRATEEAMAQCAGEFRSFNPRTGTYIMYGGEERVCPYLE